MQTERDAGMLAYIGINGAGIAASRVASALAPAVARARYVQCAGRTA